MQLLKHLDNFLTFANEVKQGHAVGQLILTDRESAMSALAELVQNCTAQQLDEFEHLFIHASLGMLTPDQRIRSMELYAYLKYLEAQHYRQWRGFCATTQPYALC